MGGKSTEVRCYDFVDKKRWQPPKTDATKRMHNLVVFISNHRAHLSRSRFVPPSEDLEELIGVRRITAEFLGEVLLNHLDLLDDFITKLPEGKESGKDAWIGAAFNARYKLKWRLGCVSPTTRRGSSRLKACR